MSSDQDMINIHICDYGCGQEAKCQFKNGKWCCSKNTSQCPAVREKLIDMRIGIYFSKKHKENLSKAQTGKHQSKESVERRAKKLKTPFEEIKKIFENEDYILLSKEKDYKNQFSYLWFRCPKGHENSMRWDHFKRGHRCSDCANKQRRITTIKNIKSRCGQCSPAYNPEGCKIIEEYGKENNYNFQHAENGGEYHIKELGYWVDGYDKEKNVVIEVDEPFHFDKNGNLLEKDLERQKEITDFLKCEFLRLKI